MLVSQPFADKSRPPNPNLSPYGPSSAPELAAHVRPPSNASRLTRTSAHGTQGPYRTPNPTRRFTVHRARTYPVKSRVSADFDTGT